MPSPIRPVSITDAAGTTVHAKHVVGVDESGNENSTEGICVTVAVHTHRRNDHVLLRSLVRNELQPFKHKSMTL
jgi:ribonuclease HIII